MILNCDVGEDSWEFLGQQLLKPVHPKGNQPWIFIGSTDSEAKAPILWPPDAKSWLIGKDPDAGKNWGQDKKGATENEMIGWHHWLNEHEFEQTQGDNEGQGSLVCCSSCGRRVGRDWTATSMYRIYIQEDPMLVLMFSYQCLKILNIVLTGEFTFYFSMDLTYYVVGSDCMPCM